MPTPWLDITAQIEGIEWIILLVIVGGVLLWGPQKLPEFARGMGRALGEFQRGRIEIEREVRSQFSDAAVVPGKPRAERAAAALGLPFTGRSEMTLKLDVARVLDSAAADQIASAARALGVFGPQASVAELRNLILKELST